MEKGQTEEEDEMVELNRMASRDRTNLKHWKVSWKKSCGRWIGFLPPTGSGGPRPPCGGVSVLRSPTTVVSGWQGSLVYLVPSRIGQLLLRPAVLPARLRSFAL